MTQHRTEEQEVIERRALEYLPRQRVELQVTPMVKRRTQEETEADFRQRSVVCTYCGKRQVPADNECVGCGVKLEAKPIRDRENEANQGER